MEYAILITTILILIATTSIVLKYFYPHLPKKSTPQNTHILKLHSSLQGRTKHIIKGLNAISSDDTHHGILPTYNHLYLIKYIKTNLSNTDTKPPLNVSEFFYVANDYYTPFKQRSNIYEIKRDSKGNVIPNYHYLSLVFWEVTPKRINSKPLTFCNLPSKSVQNLTELSQKLNPHGGYKITKEFTTLNKPKYMCEIIFKVIHGSNWYFQRIIDLRGQLPYIN